MNMQHYYGDAVRTLFLLGAGIMLIIYPLFSGTIPAQPVYNLIGIVILCVMAGLTSPRKSWVLVTNVFVSAGAFIVFEYSALLFVQVGEQNLFIINQILAICFLVSLYLSVKTARYAVSKNEGL